MEKNYEPSSLASHDLDLCRCLVKFIHVYPNLPAGIMILDQSDQEVTMTVRNDQIIESSIASLVTLINFSDFAYVDVD